MSSHTPGIKVIDDFFLGCGKVTEWLDGKQWSRSMVGSDVSSLRDSETCFIPIFSFTNPSFIHEMHSAVWHELDAYAREWEFSFSAVEDVSIQRYAIGKKYGVHSDADIGVPRVVSAVLYLNTVDVGGVTYFPHFDFGVQPVEGRLVIFPSNYVYAHEAQPPVSGEKYAAAYWARQ